MAEMEKDSRPLRGALKKPMRVAVLHNAVTPEDSLEDQDVLVQVEVVSQALAELGHQPAAVPCTLDLAAMCDRLRQLRPDVVFNLVESLGGSDSLAYLAPAVLDAIRLPYTGSPTTATFLSTHKLLAKQRLRAAGLPTPAWLAAELGREEAASIGAEAAPLPPAASWIVKGVWEQASRNLDDEAILTSCDADRLRQHLREQTARLGRPCYAEEFISGREFNLSLLDGPDRAEVLPPAEIDFSAFPPGKPRIVGYRAKWKSDSFEYHHTPRRFQFPAAEQPLLDRLRALSLSCRELFGLRGYARVDFRVDEAGQPWILEVNTNPCLSPDAGFAAALEQASIPFAQAVQRILAQAGLD
jgi:D-alanine-D-alanine ligase